MYLYFNRYIPYSIPLNDEFLTAFGKREKEYDELVGRSVDIDQTSLDVDVVDSDDDEGAGGKSKSDVNYAAISTGKVSFCVMTYSVFYLFKLVIKMTTCCCAMAST